MKENRIMVSSAIRLARNYEDFPFDLSTSPIQAEECVSRTANALTLSGVTGFELIRLDGGDERALKALVEEGLISGDLMRTAETAAVLLNRADSVSIMINEEDHLRIQAVTSGLNLQTAADRCFAVEDALSRQVRFAYDEELGYLTSCPTNTGTGMRASLVLHLPLLTRAKQMGTVGQIAAKVGLTVRGEYGEGTEALGDLYDLSNQVTLGRTEQEIISTVTAVGRQLMDMELTLRENALRDDRLRLEDEIYRAQGLLKGARLMKLAEFYPLWSSVRLGAAMNLLDYSLPLMDSLLSMAQPNHLQSFYATLPEEQARAECVRTALDSGR